MIDTAWAPSPCAVFTIGGGIGNWCFDIVNAVVHSARMQQTKCYLFFWQRRRNPHLHGRLQDVLNLDSVSQFGSSFSQLSNEQAHDLAHFAAADAVWSHRTKHMVLVDCGKVSFVTMHITPKTYSAELARKVWLALEPEKTVMDTANSLASDLIHPTTLGVHVRRTDHGKSISKSTNEKFFKEVDSRLGESHDRIFLATDDDSIEKEFTKRYGNLVCFSKKSSTKRWGNIYARSRFITIDTYKEGLIDIVLLGKCDVILGSFKSSFSKAAAKMSKTGAKFQLVI